MVKYYFPNLPNWIDPQSVEAYSPHYVAEVKKNGWRCLAWKKKDGLELWTRRQTKISDKLPITREYLSLLPPDTIIDGELIDRRTKSIKDHYYAFDILFYEGKSVMNFEWWQRRELLEKIVAKYGIWVELAQPKQLGFSHLYKMALESGDEGIVLKNAYSKYLVDLKKCPHNPHWFKAKQAEKCFVNA